MIRRIGLLGIILLFRFEGDGVTGKGEGAGVYGSVFFYSGFWMVKMCDARCFAGVIDLSEGCKLYVFRMV